MAVRDHVTLSVMVKGGDWAYGCQLVDEAFAQLPALSPPPRIFTIMTSSPAAAAGMRAREMNLYRRYFDLVAEGRKTIEVRVQYPNLRNLKAGDHIRFVCGRDDALTQVRRVASYTSFEAMFDSEGPDNVNPDSRREQQLANIRRIYGPERKLSAYSPSR